MKKVLLIQDVISNYRVPVYNILAKNFEFTLLYSRGKVPEGVEFPVIQHESKRIGPFTYHKRGFSKILRDFDVVLFLFNPMDISLLWEIIKNKTKKQHKYIPWGIGVPASYNVMYDDPTKRVNLFLTKFLIWLSDAVIFYSDYPVNKYSALGMDRQKMFVAHNTVAIYQSEDCIEKVVERTSLLFVGSLYKQKGIGLLLDAYEKALAITPDLIPLYIVGGGAEFDDISEYVISKKLTQKVFLTGPIYDEAVLSSYFQQARACISPNQAGLSVQKSLGYGVPFITRKGAITGGEIFDIENNQTGVLYEGDEQLVDIILDINANPQKYFEMGCAGREFYKENRTIESMAQGVIDAIEYVGASY